MGRDAEFSAEYIVNQQSVKQIDVSYIITLDNQPISATIAFFNELIEEVKRNLGNPIDIYSKDSLGKKNPTFLEDDIVTAYKDSPTEITFNYEFKMNSGIITVLLGTYKSHAVVLIMFINLYQIPV